MAEAFLYLGAFLPLLWGVAHLFPTKSIVRGFGEITHDNKHIIAMEWIVEGLSLIFVGVLVAAVTFIDPANVLSKAVYLVSAGYMMFMAAVSLFTGFKINFLPFRMCPFVFSSSALLLTLGALIS